LRELEAIGFVTIRPHRGTVVRDFSAAELREIYVVRGALEEAATRLATPRFAGDVSRLQFQIDAMVAAARRRDLNGLCRHSVQFHRLIMEEAGNDLLLGMWGSLQIETRTIITLLAPGLDLVAIAGTHQPLTDAIAAGDVELACRLAREHQNFFEQLPTVETGTDRPEQAAAAKPAA
jgi:DNA-binding GntR family transcriptional regulator